VDVILQELDKADGGLSVRELEARLNLRHLQLEKALNFLSVEMPSPITKIGSKWNVTATARTYRIDQSYVDAITSIRKQEQTQMQAYMAHSGCLMEFLSRALDDPEAGKCGKCAGCRGQPLLSPEYDHNLANKAAIYLRRSYQSLQPRKQWPSGGALPTYGFSGRIGNALCAQEGRALCLWRDAGWGLMVADGKLEQGRFDDKLVKACVDMIRQWNPAPAPKWITCIPSLNRPELLPDFARRLADVMELPFLACIQKVKTNPQQKEMQNSFQQAHNLDGVFAVAPGTAPDGSCLLIDDTMDSGWTFTVAAAILRKAGCAAVFPLALALNSPRMD
jgi:ATP-dependent DNA helicase RecQ